MIYTVCKVLRSYFVCLCWDYRTFKITSFGQRSLEGLTPILIALIFIDALCVS